MRANSAALPTSSIAFSSAVMARTINASFAKSKRDVCCAGAANNKRFVYMGRLPFSDVLRWQEAKGLTRADVARALDVSSQKLNGWRSRGQVSTDESDRIAQIIEQRPHSDRVKSATDEISVEPGPAIRGHVPLLDWVQAGPWTAAEDPMDLSECERVPITAPVRARTFALRVANTSMSPEFPPGTVIIVEPELDPRPGDYVIVANGASEATFKQLESDGGSWQLRPLNPQYSAQPLHEHSRIIGVVIAKMGKIYR